MRGDMKQHSGESVSEAFSGSLARVRQALCDLEDAARLPAESNVGWGEVIIAAAEVEYAAGELRRAVDLRAPSAGARTDDRDA